MFWTALYVNHDFLIWLLIFLEFLTVPSWEARNSLTASSSSSCASLRGRVKLAKFLLPSLMLPTLYSVTHWFFAPVEYWALLLWNLDFSKSPPLPGCLAKSAFCTCSQTTALRGWGHSQILQPIWRSVCLLPDTQEAGLLLDPLDPMSPTEAFAHEQMLTFSFLKGTKMMDI